MMKNIFTLLLITAATQLQAQNVGIGNNDPAHKLDISGRMRIRGGADLFNSAGVYLGGVGAESLVIKSLMGMASDTSVGFYGYGGSGWGFTTDIRNGNTAIGEGTPLDKSGFTVNNKVGAVNAMFGSNTSGISIESAHPGIGFNTYFNGSRKLMINGYGAYIGSSNVSGGLQLAVTDVINTGGSTVNTIAAIDIKPNGNVGIGVTDPAYKLDIGTRMRIRSAPGGFTAGLWLNDAANSSSPAFIGMQSDNQVGFWGSGNGWGLTMNTSNGNTGIGTVSSNAPLQFGNTVVNRKIVLYESSNNDNQFYGFGVNSSALRYQTPGVNDDHVFYSGSGPSSSIELVRIKGNGNVGIGNNDPAYRLDVKGRMRIRADGGTAGIWFNNSLNTQLRGFIGMENEDVFGLYGDAGAGWALRMSTSSGDIEASKNVTINGFTRLGELSPAIKTKIIIGTVPALGINTYPHGLSNSSKIVSIDALAAVAGSSTGAQVKPGYFLGVGFTYQLMITDTDVAVVAPPIPFDCAFVAGQTVKIFITYTQ